MLAFGNRVRTMGVSGGPRAQGLRDYAVIHPHELPCRDSAPLGGRELSDREKFGETSAR